MHTSSDTQVSRGVAIGFTSLAAGALIYMGALAASDALAAKALGTRSAHSFATIACHRIAGCEHLLLTASFNWGTASRSVVYGFVQSPHTRFSARRALRTIHLLDQHEPSPWLSWALDAKAVVSVRHARLTGTFTRHGGRR